MGTSATYEITDDEREVSATFYCHYDNYLEGAATRFREVLKAEDALTAPACPWLPELFAVAIKDAEPIDNHSAAPYTDYKYTLNIMAEGRFLIVKDSSGQLLYNGPLSEWLAMI